MVVGHDGYTVLRKGYGRLEWLQSSPVVTDESIYDLASLTKVIATTTAAMILYDEGKLPLDAPVRQFLPEFTRRSQGSRHDPPAAHASFGTPCRAHPLTRAKSPADARRMVLATPLGCPPGKCFTYSDIGADILGWAIENIAGESLDKFVAHRVFEPLQMHDTFFRPDPALDGRIAPTQDTSPRGHAIRGEVHDVSAYELGGVAGHAGLFSTAADLAVFAQMLLNGGEFGGRRIVADSTVRLFTTEVADHRALGWETPNHVHGAGELFSTRAFGHIGYTGTSIWIDPERKLFVVLLTNRTYAPRVRHPADAIADVRNDLADAASLSRGRGPANDGTRHAGGVPVRHGENVESSGAASLASRGGARDVGPCQRPCMWPQGRAEPPRSIHRRPNRPLRHRRGRNSPRRTAEYRPGIDRGMMFHAMETTPPVAVPLPAVTEDLVRLALRRVRDPELNLNIVDIGLVYAIRVDGAKVEVDVSLTSPGCPSGVEILKGAEDEVKAMEGVGEVVINLVWTPPWTPDRIEPRVRAYLGF